MATGGGPRHFRAKRNRRAQCRATRNSDPRRTRLPQNGRPGHIRLTQNSSLEAKPPSSHTRSSAADKSPTSQCV
eukprot:5769056-Lingulodinium_polyedra.AAC.1